MAAVKKKYRKPGKIHAVLVSTALSRRQAETKAREIADKGIIKYSKTESYHEFVLRKKSAFKRIGTKTVNREILMLYGALKNPCRPVRNPKNANLARLARMFKDYHGFEPGQVNMVRINTRIPKQLVQIGTLREILYYSDKDNPGRHRRYIHDFKKPYPILCTDVSCRRLFIIGGKFRVKAEGLVN